MYFFILLLMIIPLKLEHDKVFILYFKIFITSIIYFINIDKSIITTIICFLINTILIYKIVKYSYKEKDDHTFFNLAHEVKNPLCVCKGYLDMIDLNDIEKSSKYIEIVKKEMDRSLNIMDGFLDLKRIKLEKDLMDFSLLISDIEETLKNVLKIKLEIKNTSKEVIIEGDYERLKQVLINLIKNSIEANSTQISINLKTNSNTLKVSVMDNGCGIKKEQLDRIDEVFYTTKENGSGLGVNLSKEIIKLHDGTLSYKSNINKGTIATIVLPIKYIF